MTTPADRLDDRVLVTSSTVTVDVWRHPELRAEVALSLEEDLTRRARDAGRELREERVEELVWLRRHEWTDQETGAPRTWDEHVIELEADRVTVVLSARAYRPAAP